MGAIDTIELAGHLDRVRRLAMPHRAGVRIGELSNGWLSAESQGPLAEFASASMDRIYWLTPGRVISRADVDEAFAAARAMGRGGMHIWLAPWAWDDGVEAILQAAGVRRVPYVEYIALARPAGPCEPTRATGLDLRRVEPAQIDDVMRQIAPWYTGAGMAVRMAASGDTEIHAAFDGPRAVAVGLLTTDGAWAYLSAAATGPDDRGRGAQTALICARVQRAAELGARWCSCETNTAVEVSLRNLWRCAFVDVIRWRVYRWENPGDGKPCPT